MSGLSDLREQVSGR